MGDYALCPMLDRLFSDLMRISEGADPPCVPSSGLGAGHSDRSTDAESGRT